MGQYPETVVGKFKGILSIKFWASLRPSSTFPTLCRSARMRLYFSRRWAFEGLVSRKLVNGSFTSKTKDFYGRRDRSNRRPYDPLWPAGAGGRHMPTEHRRQGQLPNGRHWPRDISAQTRSAVLAHPNSSLLYAKIKLCPCIF